ncbi:MAG: TIGR02597 family protein [Opitutales bacterium]|nr:TIGR02597 family protein [Opitutales bacterium]
MFGFFKNDVAANSEFYLGVNTTRDSVFNGEVQSALSGGKITLKGEPGWAQNQFVFSEGAQGEHFYLKFVSGELEGAWFDISANDSSSVSVSIGASELAKISSGDKVKIIPHWTLSTLLPEGGGVSPATKISQTQDATILYKYTGFGAGGVEYSIGENKAPLRTFVYRKRGSNVGWRDADKEDASNEVIEPGSVLILSQPESQACEVAYTGIVPMCATSIELFTLDDGSGVQNQDIFLASPSVAKFALSELTAVLVDTGAFAPSTGISSNAVDVLYVYENKSAGQNIAPDNSYYYRRRGTVSKWLDANKADADTSVIPAGAAIVIRKLAGTDEFAARVKFTPEYISNKNQ